MDKITGAIINYLTDKLKLDDRKIMFVAPLLIIIIILDLVFPLKMQYRAVKSSGVKISELKNNIDTLNKNLRIMEQNRAKQEKSQAAAITKKMITEEEIPALLQEIYGIANKYNIKIDQIKPSRDVNAKGETVAGVKIFPVTITLNLNSNYHSLGSFLNDLDNAQEFIATQEMSISRSTTDYLRQNVRLVLKTYVKK